MLKAYIRQRPTINREFHPVRRRNPFPHIFFNYCTKTSRYDHVRMTAKKKVALVEDSTDTAELMTVFLSRLCDDFQVCPFGTGLALLETFQRGVYWVIILDISLPEMDGYEVLHRGAAD